MKSVAASTAQLRAIHSIFKMHAPQLFSHFGAAGVPRAADHASSRDGEAVRTTLLDCGFPITVPSAEPIAHYGSTAISRTRSAKAGVNQLQLSLFEPQPKEMNEREQRLAVAARVIGREIASFTELSSDEAASLIDSLKKALGQETRPRRTRPDRDQAQAYGTAGRRANQSNEIRLVDEETLQLVNRLVAQLGWTLQQFDGFLASKSSPLRSGAIRTLPEANKVIWALKNMVRAKERRESKNNNRRAFC